MGDEDGATFVIKEDNIFTIYRVEGWRYGKRTKDFSSIENINIFIWNLIMVFQL